jgi:hypothetical protein
MNRRSALYLSGVVAAAAILGGVWLHGGRGTTTGAVWHEIAWPFPRDAWPPGKAFRCTSNACEGGAELYVRPKIGFCNCATGVADDEEVDRVTDLDLISERFTPVETGHEVHISGMPGRLRHYSLRMQDGTDRQAIGLAISHQCDVVVAVTQGKFAAAPQMERAAIDLLSSKPLSAWLSSALNGS